MAGSKSNTLGTNVPTVGANKKVYVPFLFYGANCFVFMKSTIFVGLLTHQLLASASNV